MNQVHRFLRKVYRGVGTPLSLAASMLLDHGGIEAVQNNLNQRVPSAYIDPQAYHLDNLVVELTRKLRLPGDSEEMRVRAAIETFYRCEAENYRTDARLTPYLNNSLWDHEQGVGAFIKRWRKIVKDVLGPLPRVLDPCFTNGSSLSDKGDLTTIPDKMSSTPTVYGGSLDIWRHSIAGTIFERQFEVVELDYNRFFTVPKSSETHRGCCIEASAAILLQRAIAKELLGRYSWRYGVSPIRAKELHHALAREASLTGNLATIDLSSASDTLAHALVRLILPPKWYELLFALRAKYTLIDGKKVFLYKFSSMGNGYTFELETLLFRTLLEACGVGLYDCSVLGDDIIVPSAKAADCIAALKFFGFSVNQSKTFCEGPFRESCGGDFFLGEPVRAHYLKELPDEPQHWVALANGLRRVDPNLKWLSAAWHFCVDQVPRLWRNFGPEHLGDVVIHDPDATPTLRSVSSETSLRFRTIIESPTQWRREPLPEEDLSYEMPGFFGMVPIVRRLSLERGWAHDVRLACLSMGLGDWVSPRDSVTGYARRFIPEYGLAAVPSWLESRIKFRS